MSETEKHRHLAAEYCVGNGVDLGSGGDPIVPWAIQFDLPEPEYKHYNSDRPITHQWRGDARDLPFRNGVLDWLHSSHLLEDFSDWRPVLQEWSRCIRRLGYIIIAVPDHQRFRAAVAAGQGDNLGHRHESHQGEIRRYLPYYRVIYDGFVNADPKEYSLLFIGQKMYDYQ